MCQRKSIYDYKELDDYLINEWYHNLLERNGLVIAISRKGPRLLSYCAQKIEDCEEYRSLRGKRLNIVTEIALPFIDFSQYNNVTIIDDAVYHGTTFDKIVNLVDQSLSKLTNKPTLFLSPAVITAAAMQMQCNDRLDKNVVLLEDKYIPFYVDTIIQRFSIIGKTYDIEFPIFSIEINNKIEDDLLKAKFANIARRIETMYNIPEQSLFDYVSEQYIREDICNHQFACYTIVLDKLYEDANYNKPDFAKLRITWANNRINVTSYCVMPLLDNKLDENSPYLYGEIVDSWNKISRTIKDNLSNNTAEDFYSDSEYSYQLSKTKAVAMNFIYGYYQFQKLKKAFQIEFLTTGNDFKLDMDDAKCIFANNIPYILLDESYNESFSPFSQTKTNVELNRPETRFFPKQYALDYAIQLKNDFSTCETYDECLSCEFGNMHRWIELPSRLSSRASYGRLRFGESYTSLKANLEALSKKDGDLPLALHKGLDLRIDRGSVVPNYVLLNSDSGLYWARLFRSGENEDIRRDQILRPFVYLIKLFFDEEYRSIIHKEELNFLLKFIEQFGGIYQKSTFCNYSKDQLIQFAEKNNVLRSKEDSSIFYELCDNALVGQLKSGTIYDKKTDEVFILTAKTASRLADMSDESQFFDYISDSNKLFVYNETFISNKLSSWKKQIQDCFYNESYSDDKANELIDLTLEMSNTLPTEQSFNNLKEIYNNLSTISVESENSLQKWYRELPTDKLEEQIFKLALATSILLVIYVYKGIIKESDIIYGDDSTINFKYLHKLSDSQREVSKWFFKEDTLKTLKNIEVNQMQDRFNQILAIF